MNDESSFETRIPDKVIWGTRFISVSFTHIDSVTKTPSVRKTASTLFCDSSPYIMTAKEATYSVCHHSCVISNLER